MFFKLKMNKSPNVILRKLQKRGWARYSVEIQTWIMMVNYFFAIVPGIIYLIRNVFIKDEIIMTQASLKDTGYWTFLIVSSFGLIQSVFQIIQYNRFMSLRLVKTFFIGQCIGLFLILLGANKTFIELLRNMVQVDQNDDFWKTSGKKGGLFCILLLFSYIVFFAYRFSPFSEITK